MGELFKELFDFMLPAIVNFVGGGGKTGAILSLLREYAPNVPVIYSTTTRIHPPHPSHGVANMVCDDEAFLRTILAGMGEEHLPRPISLVLTSRRLRPGLNQGLPPSFARGLDARLFPLILNEADGARSMSLKMPREGEPVLMEGAQYLVPVIGMDVIGKPLGPATLFRWEMAVERFSLQSDEIITPEVAARLLLHPQGVCKGWSPGTRIVPFVNKVDTPELDRQALRLAQALLAAENFPVDRVVWGSLQACRACYATSKSDQA